MKYAKLFVLIFGMSGWVGFWSLSAINYAPERPDGVVYALGQIIFLPGIFLFSPKLFELEDRFRRIGAKLVAIAFGFFFVAVMLYFLGGNSGM